MLSFFKDLIDCCEARFAQRHRKNIVRLPQTALGFKCQLSILLGFQGRAKLHSDKTLWLFFQGCNRFKIARIENLTTAAADHLTLIGFARLSLLQRCATFRATQTILKILVFLLRWAHDVPPLILDPHMNTKDDIGAFSNMSWICKKAPT